MKLNKLTRDMSGLNEMNLRWLAASIGLPENEQEWNEEQMEHWILVVHDYEDKLSVKRLREQLKRRLITGKKKRRLVLEESRPSIS